MAKEGMQERLEMEDAAKASEKVMAQVDSEGKPLPKLPRRYKLYDKIRDKISLRVVDAVIAVSAILIVVILVLSIATNH